MGITMGNDGPELHTPFQQLQGRIGEEGLTLESTSSDTDSLQLVAKSFVRGNKSHVLPASGKVSMNTRAVAFTRPNLTEEYSVSAEGVRQDFIIETRLEGTGELRINLSVRGARARIKGTEAELVLEKSKRTLIYHRLLVTDAGGRTLAARMEVPADDSLAIVVNDDAAIYPIRIDPTFSDADWVSLNPGIVGTSNVVNSVETDEAGNLYIGGYFTAVGGVAANHIAKWDGNSWSALGAGLPGPVNVVMAGGGKLYAGGNFAAGGGYCIASWDGSTWSSVLTLPLATLGSSFTTSTCFGHL